MRPRNLVRDAEIERVVNLARQLGLPIGPLEVRVDGVTIHPPATQGSGNAYDQWKKAG